VGVTRDLLELRDQALAVAREGNDTRRVVAVDPALRGVLRSQSLLVLEVNHHRFEDVCDLAPDELLATA
jgi:hypothetical protein